MQVNLIKSETWLDGDSEKICSILNETIKEFVADDERIINIESKTKDSGLVRFWIYTTKITQPVSPVELHIRAQPTDFIVIFGKA